ncbi:hypothetical protein OIU84_021700 [Salix udensis]|uniref:TPX2 C-terminal domain-containing protein n=1 Tax=Salix udensis TaxID=889485 RepID=A0AAD6PHV0_9ROSI|nr:hypothetical protein OIU84_021700 [Salix udensis]
MGESACLLRSFSHPSSASREAKEGNPLRALTESISFGRFMSESLAWEKWSAFSHNRYLEEVEQFSKPGSVAQKKAYFEAHYKKRAAMKAAALLEQANAASNVPQVEAPCEAPNSSHVYSEILKETNDVIINEQDEGSADAGLIQSSDANEFYADEQKDDLQNVKVEGNEVVREKNVEMENSIQVENVKENENAEDRDITVAMPEEKMPNKSRASILPRSSARLSSSARLRAETNDSPNNTSKRSLRVSKDRSATPEIPTKGSVYGVSKLLPSVFQRSQDRSTKSELNKSVSGKITAGGISQTLSSDCSKSSSAKGSRSRPPLISSPFSFRSDERAAKRKEFFEKLGEKNNAKEDTEKKHLQARPKEKGEYDLKKLRQSAVFRGKPRDDLHGGLRSPENSMKKISLARPRSPKLGRTSTSNVAREASLQLHRPSVNAERSKPVIQRSNHSSTRSVVTLLLKTNAHENASPNIQP